MLGLKRCGIKLNKLLGDKEKTMQDLPIQRAKVVIINMAVTALEAAVGFLAVSGWNISDKTVLAGAVGAGLSAAWNTILKPWLKSNTGLYK